MEGDAFPQVERDGQPVLRHGPIAGQRRIDRTIGSQAQQGLIDGVGHLFERQRRAAHAHIKRHNSFAHTNDEFVHGILRGNRNR